MKRIFVTLACILCLGVLAHRALAFSLTPPIIDTQVDPGGSVLQSLLLTNDETVSETYYFSIQRFIPKGEQGQQEFLPLSETSGLPSWIFLDRASVTLKPGESKTIGMAIRVPAQTRPGGYYAAVFASTQALNAGATDHVALGARVGALVLLRVNGPAVESLRVLGFTREQADPISHLPVTFGVEVENDGSVHLAPQGQITIKNFYGQTVAKLAVNREGARVLPDGKRILTVTWEKEPATSGVGFWHEVGEEWRNFSIGPYTATLVLTGPGTQGIAAQSVSFSIWPWRLLLVWISGLLAIVLALIWYRRWVLRRAIAKL